MALARKSGGGNVALTTVKRRSGGAWVSVQTVKRRLSGAWVTVWNAYTAMSITAPSSVSGSGTKTGGGAGPVSATTYSATDTISGGQAPFTCAWQYVSGTAATVNNPSNATTDFTRVANGTVAGNVVSGVYRLKVTDATSAVAYGPNVTVTTTHYYDSGV